MFTNDDDDDDDDEEEEEEEEGFYKPVVVKTSVKGGYKYYECKGGKDNKLSRKQYLYKIMSYLSDLVNYHKAISNESKEMKIQINMNVNFVSSNDTGEIRTIFVWSDNEEIRPGNETDIIKRLLNSFLNNYQKEETILRIGSGFVFESFYLMSYHIHKTSLKR